MSNFLRINCQSYMISVRKLNLKSKTNTRDNAINFLRLNNHDVPPYQTQNMVKIWKKQVPDMAHIWKIAGGIQSKYGFNNKALSLSFV